MGSERCHWMMSRGYHRGCRCGNNAAGEARVGTIRVALCQLHLGMAATKKTCRVKICPGDLVTEHGRWRGRKKCAACQQYLAKES